MENAALAVALLEPFPIHFASDSQSTVHKAIEFVRIAGAQEKLDEERITWTTNKEYLKPWGLQVDGDLWKMIWKAICRRGIHSLKVTKVKGHAT